MPEGNLLRCFTPVCSSTTKRKEQHMIKPLITALTLALGWGAFTSNAQSSDDSTSPPRQAVRERRAAGLRERDRQFDENRPVRGNRAARRALALQMKRNQAARLQRAPAAGPRPLWRTPQSCWAPGPRGFGALRGGPGGYAPSIPGRGPAYCPHCQRLLPPDSFPGRGPAFGPPPGTDMRPGPRGPRANPAGLQNRQGIPRRALPDRFDRPGRGPRPEGRGPANRPSPDPVDR